ncbi:hypothetical protein [Allorhizocola rhizosphaerae]|uniref:hypothetical protein n=1 Tax=Allorhizocola rhizosphaerae TaxID=1872709 RepID=UPI000E3EE130|nr:hypothetical protein [Allorhizocola rhizosphaerae]
MRPVVGLFVLLYGLVLALNTTAPAIARLVGKQVIARAEGECSGPLGKPPFGGLYGTCPAQWSGSDGGRVVGHDVSAALRDGSEPAYRYPIFNDYAVLNPSPPDQAAGIVAVLITTLGVLLLVAERRRARHDPFAEPITSDT